MLNSLISGNYRQLTCSACEFSFSQLPSPYSLRLTNYPHSISRLLRFLCAGDADTRQRSTTTKTCHHEVVLPQIHMALEVAWADRPRLIWGDTISPNDDQI
ncbi:uncharacterized protein B0T23DRAFT_380842 [Neurospora hispaniola]|uniref:Uncharacterized protein n=1 Tax=Neurospora hispaniola TaxID=588809 RepID=A0AAJ0I8I4_9PEZI|nr:hypothetical protein B0T23DRAFT_380842 [Neurospora hispaniola]